MDSNTHRTPVIDGLRGLSALWVILYDLWVFARHPDCGPMTAVFANGHLGVEIFMVLSGYCLFAPLVGRERLSPGTWRRFAWRRLTRILPPYYVAMAYAIALPAIAAVLFAWVPLWPTGHWTPRLPDAWDFTSHLLLVHNLFPAVRSGINPSFWSLSLEAQFYVVFPFLALLLRRRLGLGLAALALLCVLVRALGIAQGVSAIAWPLTSVLGRLTLFALGMVTAALAPTVQARTWSGSLRALVGGCAIALGLGGAVAYNWPAHAVPFSDWGVGLAASLGILLGLGRGSVLGRFLSWPAWVGLGEMSYSFYLINRPTCQLAHDLLVRALGLAPGVTSLMLGAIVGIPVSLVLAWIMFRTVEVPWLAIGRRGWISLRTRPAMA